MPVFGMASDELMSRYPHILFRKMWQITPALSYLLGRCDAMVDAIGWMPLQPGYRKNLLRVSLIKGAQATTAIEGNTLTEEEIDRVERGDSLPASKEYQEREVRNVLDAMNRVLDEVVLDRKTPLLDAQVVLSFHRQIGADLGEHFDAIPGQFRTDARIVGPYRCPRPQDVPELMARLFAWLPKEFGFSTGRQTFADAVIQAIVTHVYVEWIHPFGDGNGRTGRLLEFYILLRAGHPDLASHILSNYYNQTRPEYYRQLDQAHTNRDLTSFVEYALKGYHDGLQEVLRTIQQSNIEVAWRHLVFSRFAELPYKKKSVFKRRRMLALALPPDRDITAREATVLTTELARAYAKVTERSALRDLRELMQLELVIEGNQQFRMNLGLLGTQMAKRILPSRAQPS